MQNQNDLFTKEELAELITSGAKVDRNKLTPPEQDMYDQAYVETRLKQHQEGGESLFGGKADLTPGVDYGAIAGAAAPFLGAGAGIPTLTNMAKSTWDVAKLGGSLYAVGKAMDAVGAPADVKNAILFALGLKGGVSGKSNRTSEAAPASIPEGVVPQKYGQKIEPFAGATKGRTMDPLQAKPGGDIYEGVVNGGVKNDFRGPVSFRKPPTLQAPSEPDILENVLGTARNGWEDGRGTPLEYGATSDAEVAEIQKLIAEALNGGAPNRNTITTAHRPLQLRRP